MAIVFCDNFCKSALGLIINGGMPASWTYRLYQNMYTPTTSDTSSNYTEATFDGYAAKTGVTWNAVGNNNPGAVITANAWTYTQTGTTITNTIYGWYATDGSGNFQWAELFSSPVSMNAVNNTITVQPEIILKSG